MVNLRRVADGAYPQSDYSFLPPDVTTWAGYLGGHTPHAWTPAEIRAAEDAGLLWWGIWTAPVGRVFTRDAAVAEAAGMVAALVAVDYPRTDPVFLDVEYSTWVADPQSCEAAVGAWRSAVAGAGWRNTHWYGPLYSTADWRADWTDVRPGSLPAGVVGWQYDHALAGDRYDISVFDFDLIYPQGAPMAWTDQQYGDVYEWLRRLDVAFNSGTATPFAERAELTHRIRTTMNVLSGVAHDIADLKTELDQVKAAVAAGGTVVHGSFVITGSGEVTTP